MGRRTIDRPPTKRQIECFETYARFGDGAEAARRLGISIQQLKRMCGQYYRRVGANSGVQAAYLTWGPKDNA
ncbi:MAG TPA: hypothetical protein VFX15_02845 [Actinomycetes bacterium]|nr:hypothetical protein [Actinomycetes bacterium]